MTFDNGPNFISSRFAGAGTLDSKLCRGVGSSYSTEFWRSQFSKHGPDTSLHLPYIRATGSRGYVGVAMQSI